MANKLYLGNSVLIDLSNYYNKSEVDTAISNVDVSDQLSDFVTNTDLSGMDLADVSYVDNAINTYVTDSLGNDVEPFIDAKIADLVDTTTLSTTLDDYVEKDGSKVLSDNNFTDALKTKLDGLSNFDPTNINSAISAIQSTLGDITGDGAAVTAALDTWNEIKAFVADYTNTGDLQDLINTTTSNIQTWVGNQGYLTSSAAASTYLSQSDASSTYLTQSNASSTYLTQSNASSTYLTSTDAASTYLTSSTAASTYQPIVSGLDATVVTKANGAVQNGGGVSTILKITQSDFNALATKNANTLYIVEDDPVQQGS